MPLLNTANALRVGSSVVSKVYKGTTKVWPPPALVTPVWQSVEYANASNAALLVFNKPAGTAAQSLLVAQVASSANSTWTGPGGAWVGPVAAAGGGAIFYLLCDGSEGSTFSFDSSSNIATHRGSLAMFTGTDLTTPVQASSSVSGGGNVSSPSVSASLNNSLLYLALVNPTSYVAANPTQPSGTDLLFSTLATSLKAGAKQTVNSGATGTKQWTSGAGALIASSIILNPRLV